MGDAFLSWRETYAVGHLGLDLEHKRLVELINEISGAGRLEHLSSLSNAFYFASVGHFRHENSVIRDIIDGAYLLPGQFAAINEAAINDHCAEHARSLIKLESMLHSFHAVEDGATLASELKTWFLDHAINHDVHLKDVFQGRMERSSGEADREQATPEQRPDRPAG
jgi:hemerythrin